RRKANRPTPPPRPKSPDAPSWSRPSSRNSSRLRVLGFVRPVPQTNRPGPPNPKPSGGRRAGSPRSRRTRPPRPRRIGFVRLGARPSFLNTTTGRIAVFTVSSKSDFGFVRALFRVPPRAVLIKRPPHHDGARPSHFIRST